MGHLLAPVVDLAFQLPARKIRLIAAIQTGGSWAVLFYVYLVLRGFAMDLLFVGLSSFAVFIAGA